MHHTSYNVLMIIILVQPWFGNFLYGRAITLDSLAVYEVSIPSSITTAERVYQAEIKEQKRQLEEKQRQKQKASAKLTQAKIETKQAKAKLEEASHNLETAQTQTEKIAQSIQESEETLFLRRLETSDNMRLKDSVAQYQQLFKVFKDFEDQYTLSNTLVDHETLQEIDFLKLSEEDMAIINETINYFKNETIDWVSVIQSMHRTIATPSKIETLKEIITLEQKEFTQKGTGRLNTGYSYLDRTANIKSNYDWIILILKKDDILNRFIRGVLVSWAPEKTRHVIPDYGVTPAFERFAFHSFTPNDRNSNTPWKLHVSGKNYDAWKVFKYMLPYLIHNKRYFKVYQSIMGLYRFYYEGAYPQTGKFFTIYPETDDESAELAKDL